jgi:hypothetical protein
MSSESSISCVTVYWCSNSDILPPSREHDWTPLSRCSSFSGTAGITSSVRVHENSPVNRRIIRVIILVVSCALALLSTRAGLLESPVTQFVIDPPVTPTRELVAAAQSMCCMVHQRSFRREPCKWTYTGSMTLSEVRYSSDAPMDISLPRSDHSPLCGPLVCLCRITYSTILSNTR